MQEQCCREGRRRGGEKEERAKGGLVLHSKIVPVLAAKKFGIWLRNCMGEIIEF
jgi:hypothetical protein